MLIHLKFINYSDVLEWLVLNAFISLNNCPQHLVQADISNYSAKETNDYRFVYVKTKP